MSLHDEILQQQHVRWNELLILHKQSSWRLSASKLKDSVCNRKFWHFIGHALLRDKYLYKLPYLKSRMNLQGIGLPLEEAMRFWRAEFAPKTSGDAFEKQYAYNIRYNYGKEGKRTDFTPYSCVKIVSSTPGQVRIRHTFTKYCQDYLWR